jgi:hypothetical protein
LQKIVSDGCAILSSNSVLHREGGRLLGKEGMLCTDSEGGLVILRKASLRLQFKNKKMQGIPRKGVTFCKCYWEDSSDCQRI